MHEAVQVSTASDLGTGERIRVTRYNTETLYDWERDTDLGILVHKWRAAGGRVVRHMFKRGCSERLGGDVRETEENPVKSAPPHQDNFKPTGENIRRIRTDKPNPQDFKWEERESPNVTGFRPVRDEEDNLLQRQLIDALIFVKGEKVPVYEQIDHRNGEIEINFLRLLLPVADDDGNIPFVYVIDRHVGNPLAMHLTFETGERAW